MKNMIYSLEDLFKLSAFRIPQYQRAYAWEVDPHLDTFLSDLRQQAQAQRENDNKKYFMGFLLLHDQGNGNIHIVDGQQRLTTVVILAAAALYRHKTKNILQNLQNVKRLRNYFIYSEIEEKQKLNTIDEDNPYFKQHVLGLSDGHESQESPSSKRLKKAFDFFLEAIHDSEWPHLLDALKTAQVMVYSIADTSEATLVFELQNDRGKSLTNLEALKSYMMHLVYLDSKNPCDDLQEMQTQFSKVYRDVERLEVLVGAPTEDALLSYHSVAFLKWSSNDWRNPKKFIKQALAKMPSENRRLWVLDFLASLRETFKVARTLLENPSSYSAFSDMLALGHMAPFWPLILKVYRSDKSEGKKDFDKACRLMEVYAMRGYGMSNLRADAGLSALYTRARDFENDFHSLHTLLHSMSSWHYIPTRFPEGLNRANNWNKKTRYLLWKYENHLRSQPGRSTPHISLQDYFANRNAPTGLSIEHIAAQKNPIYDVQVEWDKGDRRPFAEVATHRLGNLVLDSKSANSSKGNYDFTDKLDSLSTYSTFMSQGELTKWAEKSEDGQYLWTLESIKKRHQHLVEFAESNWDPNKYFTVSSGERFTEEPEDDIETDASCGG